MYSRALFHGIAIGPLNTKNACTDGKNRDRCAAQRKSMATIVRTDITARHRLSRDNFRTSSVQQSTRTFAANVKRQRIINIWKCDCWRFASNNTNAKTKTRKTRRVIIPFPTDSLLHGTIVGRKRFPSRVSHNVSTYVSCTSRSRDRSSAINRGLTLNATKGPVYIVFPSWRWLERHCS